MRTLKNVDPATDRAEADGPLDRHRVVALSRGLRILRAFEEAAGPLSNHDLVAYTGLPKSTVSRLTRTLTIEGFLVQLARTAQYKLAPAVVGLARAYQDTSGIAEVARPHMQELASEIHGTVAVAARDGLDMVYLAIARNVSRIHVPQAAGSRVPVGRTAVWFAYLHSAPAAERDAIAAAIRSRTPRDAAGFDQELLRTRREIEAAEFCVCAGTWRPDVSGAGVSLVLPDRTVIAFNASGPSFWIKEERLYAEIGPRLVAMARSVRVDFSRRGRAP